MLIHISDGQLEHPHGLPKLIQRMARIVGNVDPAQKRRIVVSKAYQLMDESGLDHLEKMFLSDSLLDMVYNCYFLGNGEPLPEFWPDLQQNTIWDSLFDLLKQQLNAIDFSCEFESRDFMNLIRSGYTWNQVLKAIREGRLESTLANMRERLKDEES